ncbi:cyanophycinase [Ideonella sp. DXS22W]|uniref:Cyanophycinase n=1 Tax=Pseudaquabacterium inlustre TaxID=2984192 RepID=A0ABU9CID0_9BURK
MKYTAWAVALTLAGLAGSMTAAKLPYTYVRLGQAADAAATLQGGTVLMGGGTDVDAAFAWMCQRSRGGDFLVLRASGTEAYNPYVRDLCTAAGAAPNSVATLIVPTAAAAQDSRVAALVRQAEAVWIAGGDQSVYVQAWKGTALQQALNERIAAGAPVGGTSAGLNVLTPFVYSAAASKGATSSQALADPFHRTMTFDRDLTAVPQLAGVIGDPHFAARDRMGRDLAFLCRVWAAGWSAAPRGIAVDEQTALLIDPAGRGTAVGSGSVYFLQAPGAPEVCAPLQPLTYRQVGVYRIEAGAASFTLPSWAGSGGTAYSVSAVQGALSASGGSIY